MTGGLLWLSFFTRLSVYKVQPCCSMNQHFLPFYSWVLFHSATFNYLFISWWAFGSFLLLIVLLLQLQKWKTSELRWSLKGLQEEKRIVLLWTSLCPSPTLLQPQYQPLCLRAPLILNLPNLPWIPVTSISNPKMIISSATISCLFPFAKPFLWFCKKLYLHFMPNLPRWDVDYLENIMFPALSNGTISCQSPSPGNRK